MKKCLFLIVCLCFLLSGCINSIMINEDLTGKEIVQKRFYYFIVEKKKYKKIQIYDKQNNYIINSYCKGNNNINVFAVIRYPKRDITDIINILNNKQSHYKAKQYLLFVWPGNKIYLTEIDRSPFFMKWLNSDHILLQMNVDGKDSLIINKHGKIIKKVNKAIVDSSWIDKQNFEFLKYKDGP